MTNRLSSLQKYSQAAAQLAAALISHSFSRGAASSCVASRLPTGTKKRQSFHPGSELPVVPFSLLKSLWFVFKT